MIVLDKLGRKSGIREFLGIEAFGKEASLVVKDLQLDEPQTFEFKFLNLHGRIFLSYNRAKQASNP